uniref:Ig-like domain repeat protein n=1 Tax=uncultured Methanobrevibacter sp. TaxID=253161 RepID=UPI0025E1FB45
DDKYNNFTKSVNITVNPKEKVDSTINVNAEDIVEGETANVLITIPGDATGNVTVILNSESSVIDINSTTVRGLNGILSMLVTYENLTAGNYTVIAVYSGNNNYNPSNATDAFVVGKTAKENATMDIDVSPVTEGQNVTVNVELPEDATGTVNAFVNGKNYTVPLKDGKATITIPKLAAGNYTIPVTYSGDDKYNSETEEVNVTVKEDQKSNIIKAPDVTKYFRGPERFVVTVTDYQGTPLVNKTVVININGASYTRNTDANGTASIALGLNSGVYNATVTVDSNTINSVVTILPTVNGSDVVKMYRNATQYYATFLDSEGKYLADGTVVRFNINGVMYDRKVSRGKGLARLNINLEQGKYIITTMNTVTGENTANNITVLSLITENRDVTKYYRNATQYTVKVLGEDGKTVGAGVTVRFNINGVFYERQTDASGIAKLNINLQAGDYIITAEYNGCMVSNNIKVLPILNATDVSMKYRDGTQFKANLVDGQGKPYVNQAVTFNINGVFYNRITDASGQAKLNINLMPGEYIITSSYNGSSIANTIKISA